MTATETNALVDNASIQFRLSGRGAHNAVMRDIWGPRSKQFANPWTPDNPSGVINLRLAENNMLHDKIEDFIRTQLRIEGVHHLTYSTGPRGSTRLKEAAAGFLVKEFSSHRRITAGEIFIFPGLTSAVDAVVWAICDEGEGIIIPRPFYNGFKVDVTHRTGALVVDASFQDLEGYRGIDDVFDPDMNILALETALATAKQNGIHVRGLLFANPHNPLGRCYSVEAIKKTAAFCGRHNIHFISDEIYARSVFHNPNLPNAPAFISTLALDLDDVIHPNLHNVLYGASKDFCANGLRLGFLYSTNTGLMSAISSNSPFSWSPHLLQDVWAGMLENDEWRQNFFATNTRMMAEQYEFATSFFKEKNIGYYEMNAGVFIWIDLRPYFLDSFPESSTNYESYNLKLSDPQSSKYLVRETLIIDTCASKGVLIAPGSAYRAEEYGWFRVTFTTGREALNEGLSRIWAALEQVREQGWD